MKRIMVVLIVLSMAALANANLSFTADGVDRDTIVTFRSETFTLGIAGDGTDQSPTPYIIVQGPGSIHGGTILYAPGSTLAAYTDAEAKIAEWEMTMEEALVFIGMSVDDGGWGQTGCVDFAHAEIVSNSATPPPTLGLLVDGIIFHCEGFGDITIKAIYWDEQGVIQSYDTLTIYSVPEPMAMCLLGLGGLFLRRRK